MPLMLETLGALKYIDAEPDEAERTTITALLTQEVGPLSTEAALHPSTIDLSDPVFTPIIQEVHTVLSTGATLIRGIDLSRYEEPDIPSLDADVDTRNASLRTAYTSQEYLSQRATNLTLLKQYGKDAWLVSNEQVSGELAAIERELAAARLSLEEVERNRRDLQEKIKGEMTGLEETWRGTVGRAIEAEVATEGLRMQIAKKRTQQR